MPGFHHRTLRVVREAAGVAICELPTDESACGKCNACSGLVNKGDRGFEIPTELLLLSRSSLARSGLAQSSLTRPSLTRSGLARSRVTVSSELRSTGMSTEQSTLLSPSFIDASPTHRSQVIDALSHPLKTGSSIDLQIPGAMLLALSSVVYLLPIILMLFFTVCCDVLLSANEGYVAMSAAAGFCLGLVAIVFLQPALRSLVTRHLTISRNH